MSATPSASRIWQDLSCQKQTRELITGIKEAVDIKVCLHSHSTSGIAPMSYQAAITSWR